jgi:putative hydrolase of the HAD superfamily
MMSFAKFKVLTFDVVGTLIDFESGVLDAVRRIGGEAAGMLPEQEVFASYLRGREIHYGRSSAAFAHVYRHMAKELRLTAGDAPAEAFQLSVLRWPAFPDSADALARLRRRFRLVAMTNADRSAFSFYSHTLGNPFHDSVTMDEAECAKPDPLFFAYNRGRQGAHGFKKEEILHVAQSQYHDIGVAKSLGYTTCWIERRQGRKGFGATPAVAKLTPPDYHYPTLAALADAVDAELG